ncbi:MAG: WG repeat-containing protein [Sphingobacterium sp.]|nr:WG repeat-containing protein [Sphingobacterium sp.]
MDTKTNKYGYIDKNGNVVIKPQFDNLNKFNEGIAAVCIGGTKHEKWGILIVMEK